MFQFESIRTRTVVGTPSTSGSKFVGEYSAFAPSNVTSPEPCSTTASSTSSSSLMVNMKSTVPTRSPKIDLSVSGVSICEGGALLADSGIGGLTHSSRTYGSAHRRKTCVAPFDTQRLTRPRDDDYRPPCNIVQHEANNLSLRRCHRFAIDGLGRYFHEPCCGDGGFVKYETESLVTITLVTAPALLIKTRCATNPLKPRQLCISWFTTLVRLRHNDGGSGGVAGGASTTGSFATSSTVPMTVLPTCITGPLPP